MKNGRILCEKIRPYLPPYLGGGHGRFKPCSLASLFCRVLTLCPAIPGGSFTPFCGQFCPAYGAYGRGIVAAAPRFGLGGLTGVRTIPRRPNGRKRVTASKAYIISYPCPRPFGLLTGWPTGKGGVTSALLSAWAISASLITPSPSLSN